MRPQPTVGSLLKHKALGKCVVVKATGRDWLAVKFDSPGVVKEFSWAISAKNFRVLKPGHTPKPLRPHKHGVWLLRYLEAHAGEFRTPGEARRIRQIAMWIYNMKAKP